MAAGPRFFRAVFFMGPLYRKGRLLAMEMRGKDGAYALEILLDAEYNGNIFKKQEETRV